MRWLLVLLFALLPIQWISIGSTPLGTGRLHQVALVVVGLSLLFAYRLRAHAPVLRWAAPFVLANLYLILAWAAVDLYNAKVPTGAVQQGLYLAVFVGVATAFYRIASGKVPGGVPALRWAAPAACAGLLVGFSIAMVRNGVNPAAAMTRAVAAGDPEIFQKEVFKASFAGFGLDEETVQGNLRHEIVGALLLAMAVSAWAIRAGSTVTAAQRFAYRAAMGIGMALLVVALSRSVLIAAAVWPLVALVRAIRSGRLSQRQLALAGAGVVAFAVLAVSGFGAVLWNRFATDTSSYESRSTKYSGAFDALGSHWLTGGFETAGVSSHNFVLDSWLRGGVFTALPALLIVIWVLVQLVTLVSRVEQRPASLVPVVAILALPLVRMGTSGGGLIPPGEWVALAFSVGVLAAVGTAVATAPARRPQHVMSG